MNPLLLKCEDLAHSFYGKTLFKGVTLELSPGSSLAITGKNGSGKSTLLKVIANLIHPARGKVALYSGEKEIPADDHYSYMGMAAPYLNLYDELTGQENLEFFSSLKGGEAFRTETLLKEAGIYDSRNKSMKNYSSGMKQRLKLCFAQIGKPAILLLDEPTTNLDKEGSDVVVNIASRQKEKGILIIATNDPAEAALCEKQINVEDYR
ncbi:MAG: ABC transporter ATP-binding protein [Ignavibacteriae bacterium]|nr:ABC transporter ATP-binding protein [Ignavibacteriota bacterium]MCB9243974.1 ABC transporter ATP-binding protein [Ignavibacteriales bacterium]